MAPVSTSRTLDHSNSILAPEKMRSNARPRRPGREERRLPPSSRRSTEKGQVSLDTEPPASSQLAPLIQALSFTYCLNLHLFVYSRTRQNFCESLPTVERVRIVRTSLVRKRSLVRVQAGPPGKLFAGNPEPYGTSSYANTKPSVASTHVCDGADNYQRARRVRILHGPTCEIRRMRGWAPTRGPVSRGAVGADVVGRHDTPVLAGRDSLPPRQRVPGSSIRITPRFV